MRMLLAIMALPYVVIAQDIAMTNNSVMPSTIPGKIVETDVAAVAALENRDVGISSILIKGLVTIKTNGKETILNAAVFTDNISTRVRIEFGNILIIDYVKKEKEVSLYLPRKDVMFKGTSEEVTKLKSWLSLLTSELSGYSLVYPNAWDANAAQRRYIREKSTMVIFSLKEDIVNVHKKVTFQKDKSNLIIENVYKYDEEGELCGLITFDNYKTIEGSLVPHKVSFAVSEDTTVIFNFQEISFNQSASPTVFEIRPAAETPLKNLGFSDWSKKDWLAP